MVLALALLLRAPVTGAEETFYNDGFSGYSEPAEVPERMLELGFVKKDFGVWQAGVYVHSRETWLAGITRSPTGFYMELTREETDGADALEDKTVGEKRKNLFPTGVWIAKGGAQYELLTNAKGDAGYFEYSSSYDTAGEYDDSKLGKVYRDKELWKSVMSKAEKTTGATAKPVSLKNLVSATLEWPDGTMGFDDYYDGRTMLSQTVTDKKSLNKLAKLFKKTDYGAGGSNCPHGAFLTLQTKNATRVIPLASDGCVSGAIGGRLLFGYGGQPWDILKVFDEIGEVRNEQGGGTSDDDYSPLITLVENYVRQYITMIGEQKLSDFSDGFVENYVKEADDLVALAQIEHNARQTPSLKYEIASFETYVESLKTFADEIHIALKAERSLSYSELDPPLLSAVKEHFFVVGKTDVGYILKRHYEAGDIFYAYTGIGLDTGKIFNAKTGRVADIKIDTDYIRRQMEEDEF